MEELLQAATLKGQLDALRPLDNEKEARIMQKFRLDWNYHSNNLEGNSLTYGETKALLLFGVTAQGKPLKDHFEVTGHNEAINMVIEVVKGDYPLTQNFIRELHTLLLKEPYQVDAQTPDGQPTKKWVQVGSYKTSPNHVQTKTGEIFYFATPEETPAKMADLIDWYNEKIEDPAVNPIVLAAEFHYKFINIHPFDDGNGRTARILMNFILMKFGYPPVIIKTEDKANYFAALQLADAGELEGFIRYIAQNLLRSLEIMTAGARGESIDEPDDIDKEIALLEKRLSGLGEKAKAVKSKGVLNQIIDKTLIPLLHITMEKNEKLYNFYVSSYSYFSLKNKPNTQLNSFNLKKANLGNENEIYIIVEFKTFNIVGYSGFDYKLIITFIFDNLYYSVYTSDNTMLFRKPYGFFLNGSEISQIVNSEMKRHTAFIEQKIAEKEAGQNPA